MEPVQDIGEFQVYFAAKPARVVTVCLAMVDAMPQEVPLLQEILRLRSEDERHQLLMTYLSTKPTWAQFVRDYMAQEEDVRHGVATACR